ncbi:SNF1-interacting protein [Exophiala xenobiotica]|uniref:Protein SIP5 n=1 Tax=Lithohypha guttulata TaxID=1690604 RepID=A0ABR0KA79_9EURO|nr:SNF1-interacting protein [Lithohypha guttulata]KAK5326275.1 SNF1-interacting protein [Exophiala xenobiotica]
MGNSQTKEARGPASQEHSAGPSGYRNDPSNSQEAAGRASRREMNPRRGSRPDISSLLGLGGSDPDISSLEARRESKAEREQRRQEKEKQARLKERERSMREEGVEAGYLVTMGVYVGIEDFSKPLVRQLMIERRLAPFWRGIDDFSQSWAEHQIMAVARGMPLPPADEVPPELEYQLLKRPSQDANKSLMVPMGPRSRAKTLASLGSASRNNSEKDLSPREFKLPHDPFVNGQPIEVFLYKDAAECPICCLYYPPYLNTTRCCEQAICSECFVQIKRPDPHPPEHTEPDPNAPAVSEEEGLAQAEGLLVSEVATCPYCKTPDFGITYAPPPFRRGLTYGSSAQPYGVMSARSSQSSVASSTLSPPPNRRRGTSLSAMAPEVITTDKIRPDWANKLATARAHAARRSAAASALHAAAYVLNDQGQRPPPGAFGRRNVLRRSTLGDDGRPSDAQLSALSFLAERHPALLADHGQAGPFMGAPPRDSSSRRNRMDDLEDMMMMEAIRLSLAAEEDRRKKEEKEAKKKAKKDEKEMKKAEKAARKNGSTSSPFGLGAGGSTSMERTESNVSSIAPDDFSKGKEAQRNGPSTPPSQADGQGYVSGADSTSWLPPSQESLTAPITIPSTAESSRRSHLRQVSNASSASSSFQETGTGTPAVNEPMFNFRSLAAMIDEEEKGDGSSHIEHAVDGLGNDSRHSSDAQEMPDEQKDKETTKSGTSKLRDVTTIDEVYDDALDGNSR